MTDAKKQSLLTPLHIDHEAFVALDEAYILDAEFKVVARCENMDYALAIVAAVNGWTEEKVLESIKMRVEYLDNMRRQRKRRT